MWRIALVLLLSTWCVQGANYFVRTNGSDGAAGTSLSVPWRTIGKAATVATSGDTVDIGPGDFGEYTDFSGNNVRWFSLSNAITRAFKFSGVSNVFSGIRFRWACDAGLRLWDSFLYVDSTAHNTIITNCAIVDQPWVAVTNWSFNPAGANTIVGPASVNFTNLGFQSNMAVWINGVSYPYRYTTVVTLTNSPVTGNAFTNGSSVRYWSNLQSSVFILTNHVTLSRAATNLYDHINNSPFLNQTLSRTNATNVVLESYTPINVGILGNWAKVDNYTNGTRGSVFRFSNQQRAVYPTNVGSTTMTFTPTQLTTETNASTWALLSGGRSPNFSGIRFIAGGGSGATNCLITTCLFSNMVGQPITLNGNNTMVTNCEMVAIVGNSFIVYSGYNYTFASNYIHNCRMPAYYGLNDVVDHTGGTYYDYYVRTLIQGTLNTINTNILFIGNWLEDIDNAGISMSHSVASDPGDIHHTTIFGNVFIGVGGPSDGGQNYMYLISNTWYRCSFQYPENGPFQGGGDPDNGYTNNVAVFSQNLMVANGNHNNFGSEGYQSIVATTNLISESNYLCGIEIAGWNPMSGWGATNGINGGDPMFINEFLPRGPDGRPWTSDDGLRLHPRSPAVGKGALGVTLATPTRPIPFFRTTLASNFIDWAGTNFNITWNSNLYAFQRTNWDRTFDYGDAIANLPRTVTFNASNTISGTWSTNNWIGTTDFLWDFGDGSRPVRTKWWPDVTHTFLRTGQVTVTLWATNSATNVASHVRNYRILEGTNFSGVVRYVATNGSDANPGTQASPYLTVTNGLARMVPGGFLDVGPGPYTNKLMDIGNGTPASNGTLASPITMVGRGAVLPPITNKVSYWTFEGFEISAVDTNLNFCWYVSEPQTNLTFRNLYMADTPFGTKPFFFAPGGGAGSRGVYFTNCQFYHIKAKDGNWVIQRAHDVVIDGCILEWSENEADIRVDGTNVVIRRNYYFAHGYTNNSHADFIAYVNTHGTPNIGNYVIEQNWFEQPSIAVQLFNSRTNIYVTFSTASLNGETVTINGVTRTFGASSSSSTILAGANANTAATNFYNNAIAFPWSPDWRINWYGQSEIQVRGNIGPQAMTFSKTGSWGTIGSPGIEWGMPTEIANLGNGTGLGEWQAGFTNFIWRNNVILNVYLPLNPAVGDGHKFYNNLFGHCVWWTTLPVAVISSSSGSSMGTEFFNNIFWENGSDTNSSWYDNGTLLRHTNVTIVADYNFAVASNNLAMDRWQPGDPTNQFYSLWAIPQIAAGAIAAGVPPVTQPAQEVNGINGGSPGFTDSANNNFNLAPTSQLINRGVTGKVTTDFWGLTRSGTPDIGPMEAFSVTPAAPGTVLTNFTVIDILGNTGPLQVVRFDYSTTVSGALDPANTRVYRSLNGGTSNSITSQVLTNGVASPTEMQVAVFTYMPAYSTQTFSVVAGETPITTNAFGFINGHTNSDGAGTWKWQRTNGLLGVRIVTDQLATGSNLAPVQAFGLANGSWVSGLYGGTNTNWLYDLGASQPTFHADSTNLYRFCATNMTVAILDDGPLVSRFEVRMLYNKRAYGTITTNGPGFFKCQIILEAGRPSMVIEPWTDGRVEWNLEFFAMIPAQEFRYRGQETFSLRWGHYWGNPLGPTFLPGQQAQYNFWDAIRNENYTTNIYPTGSVGGSDPFLAPSNPIPTVRSWNKYVYNGGFWWLLWNTNGAITAPTIGFGGGRAGRDIGAGAGYVGPGIFMFTTNKVGIAFKGERDSTNNAGAFATEYRQNYWLYTSTNGNVINSTNFYSSPIMVEHGMRSMFRIEDINTKNLNYASLTNYGAMYLPLGWVTNTLAWPIRNGDTALYNDLSDDSSINEAQTIYDMWWTDNTTPAYTLSVGVISNFIHRAYNAPTGYQALIYDSLNDAQRFQRVLPVLDALLGDFNVTADQFNRGKAAMAMAANILYSPDWFPVDNYDSNVVEFGPDNMPFQFAGARQQFAARLGDFYPPTAPRVDPILPILTNALSEYINVYGAPKGSSDYIGATVAPTIATMMIGKVNGHWDAWTALIQRMTNYAQFLFQMSTPRDPRFGGTNRVTVAIGDTQLVRDGGLLAPLTGGLYDLDTNLCMRIIGAWNKGSRQDSSFFYPDPLATRREIPSNSPVVLHNNFPGYMSVFRTGYDTTNESVLWLLNGEHYSDHRQLDRGTAMLFAKRCPVSVSFAARTGNPSGANLKSIVIEESLFPTWSVSNAYVTLNQPETFAASTNSLYLPYYKSGLADAALTNNITLGWNRAVKALYYDNDWPVFEFNEKFYGAATSNPKIWSMNLMATGAVTTPSGSFTPVQTERAGGTPTSTSPTLGLTNGLSTFAFTGTAWNAHETKGINFDVVVWNQGSLTNRWTIQNWSHTDSGDLNTDFANWNGYANIERQHILRIGGTNDWRVFILPRLKGQTSPTVTTNGNGNSVTILASGRMWRVDTNQAIFTNNFVQAASAFDATTVTNTGTGLSFGGGRGEVVIENTNSLTLTFESGIGQRVIHVPTYATNRYHKLRPAASGRNLQILYR